MELRLTALRTELAVAFNEATGCTLSKKEVSDLAELFHYVGAEDLKYVAGCLTKWVYIF